VSEVLQEPGEELTLSKWIFEVLDIFSSCSSEFSENFRVMKEHSKWFSESKGALQTQPMVNYIIL
jgi:hypothetical protein